MKTKLFVRIIATALTCLQLLILGACSPSDVPAPGPSDSSSDSISNDETSPAVTMTLQLAENGASKYKVIRPSSASEKLISAATELRRELMSRTGANIGIAEDWVRKDSELDPNAYEILIGYTNRPASSICESMNVNDYSITISNNSVVIAGGSDAAIITAIELFLAQCVSGATVTLSGRLEHIEPLAAPNFTIGGNTIKDFKMIYSATAEDEEGKTIANALYTQLHSLAGAKLDQATDNSKNDSEHNIFIGPTKDSYSTSLYSIGFDTFDYRMEVKDGQLYLAGGSCFALQYCVNLLSSDYLKRGASLDDGLVLTGSCYGKQLYALDEANDVRIMSNNVWQCDNNRPVWIALGEDCSAKVRAPGLAAVYMAYAPDVICFQEMSQLMIALIRRELSQNGYDYKLLSYTSGSSSTDFTCILYRADTLELLDRGHHYYDYGNNGGTKSFTWGYFKHLATGKTFSALSTHLWYKSEANQPGSDDIRTRQAAEIVEAMNKLSTKYDAPIFIMGDFNTRATTEAIKTLERGGFDNTFDRALLYKSDHQGRHTCSPDDGFSRESSPATYKTQAIDHILIKDNGQTDINIFNHVCPYFYIKLSDHYPVYVDVKFN